MSTDYNWILSKIFLYDISDRQNAERCLQLIFVYRSHLSALVYFEEQALGQARADEVVGHVGRLVDWVGIFGDFGQADSRGAGVVIGSSR